MGFWKRPGRLEKPFLFSFENLSKAERKGDVHALLKEAAGVYTPEDLEEMLIRYGKKLQYIPKDYADALMISAREQIIDGYHKLMTTNLSDVHERVKVKRSWKEFCREAELLTSDNSSSSNLRRLKYLIAGFTMYILEEPAHPVGTPFPGGYHVELFEGVYYCPVRSVQSEVDETLCRFCPAVQSRERDLVLTKAEREFVESSEKLENYFYNFKG